MSHNQVPDNDYVLLQNRIPRFLPDVEVYDTELTRKSLREPILSFLCSLFRHNC